MKYLLPESALWIGHWIVTGNLNKI